MNAPTNLQHFKADAGKLRPTLLMDGMPRSLMMVIAVLGYGEQKYVAHSWRNVNTERYRDAKFRHIFDELVGFGDSDEESGLLHQAHEICNSLFILEQKLDQLSPAEFRELLKFNVPPQNHKRDFEPSPEDYLKDTIEVDLNLTTDDLITEIPE